MRMLTFPFIITHESSLPETRRICLRIFFLYLKKAWIMNTPKCCINLLTFCVWVVCFILDSCNKSFCTILLFSWLVCTILLFNTVFSFPFLDSCSLVRYLYTLGAVPAIFHPLLLYLCKIRYIIIIYS